MEALLIEEAEKKKREADQIEAAEKKYIGGAGLCFKWSTPSARPKMTTILAGFEETCVLPFFEYSRASLSESLVEGGRSATLISRKVFNAFHGILAAYSGSCNWSIDGVPDDGAGRESIMWIKSIKIYDYVKNLYTRFIKEIIKPSIQQVGDTELLSKASKCSNLITILEETLKKYFSSILDNLELNKSNCASSINLYMEEVNGKKATAGDVSSFKKLIADIKKKEFFEELQHKLKTIITELINTFRQGDWNNADSSLVRLRPDTRYEYISSSVRQLFEGIDGGSQAKDCYKSCILEPFRESCKRFYQEKMAKEWKDLEIASLNGRGTEYFMNYLVATLDLERERANLCLNADGKSIVYRDLVDLLVTTNVSKIKSGLGLIFDDIFSLERFKTDQRLGGSEGSAETMELAKKAFDIFTEYDRIKGNNNELCTVVAERFGAHIQRDLKHFIDEKSREATLEKNDKNDSFQFLLSFLNLYDIFMRLADFKVFNKHPVVKLTCDNVYTKVVDEKEFLEKGFLGKPFHEAMGFFTNLLLDKNFKKDESVRAEALFPSIRDVCLKLKNKLDLFQTFENNIFFRVAEDCYETDPERLFIGILTQQFGIANTYRLSQILNGVVESQKLAADFAGIEEKSGTRCPIDIYPLSICLPREFKQKRVEIGFSPSGTLCPCYKPLHDAFESIQRMYKELQELQVGQGRADKCLVPLYANGTCVVKCKLPGWNGKITSSVLQSYILTVFNSEYSSGARDADGYITFQQVLDLTMFGSGNQNPEIKIDLTRIMKHWVGCKVILTDNADWQKVPKAFDPSCKFKPNRGFATSKKQLSVPCIRFGDEKINEASKNDGNTRIDCAIVRIMKSRGRLRGQELSQEVLRQLRDIFQPSQREMQKRIEILMDQNYMRRDGDQSDTFVYMS